MEFVQCNHIPLFVKKIHAVCTVLCEDSEAITLSPTACDWCTVAEVIYACVDNCLLLNSVVVQGTANCPEAHSRPLESQAPALKVSPQAPPRQRWSWVLIWRARATST
jgi:hypothetical protein